MKGSSTHRSWVSSATTALATLVATLAVIVGGDTGISPAGATSGGGALQAPAGCTTSHVLLLGSYPSEVSANLDREVLAPGQPTVLSGIDFYAGTLDGNGVVIAIAGPSPAETYATTLLALRHFSCTSAVVFSGTAGGGGASGLGDVTVPSAWTSDGGATFSPVSAAALAVAREVAAKATGELGATAPIDDGPCLCQGVAHSLAVVPILRTPRVLVGGLGTTYGGQADTCSAAGGMLLGCNPCPPQTGAPLASVSVPISVGVTAAGLARQVSLEVSSGSLVAGARSKLARLSPPPPSTMAETAIGPTYVADDQQTTGAQQAAAVEGVPFIAFRGISDTSAVGNLWPFEWLVFQQLAADNSAAAVRLWLARWDGN
jgi:nucleoside phosphorylase